MKTPASEKAQNIEAVYPLSPLQQGMIFHSLFAPGSGVYIEQLNCRFHGELDADAFQRACQAVVDRHAILRTAFVGESQGELMQVVVKRVKLPFELLDWGGLSDEEQQSRLEELQQADRAEGFKLARAPLMRLRLIRLGEGLHHFVWSHHHLLLDGWSVPLVMREVLTAYESFRRGAAPAWAEARPYRDYIAWLGRQDMAAARGYWERTLAGVSGATRLGLSWAQGTGRAGAGERRVRLTAEESEVVRRAAQAMQVTVNTLVQGAWALLLSRLSGEGEVIYGVTVSGRPAELEGVGEMVGLFINSLPARVRVEPEWEVGEWLRGLQAAQAEGRQYEYSPLQEVQRWAGVGGGARLFESLVVFENYPVESLLEEQAGSLQIDDVRLTEHTNYPLTVVAELRDRLVVRLKYDASQYDEATVDTLLDYLSRIVTQMAAGAKQKLSHVTLLNAAEREKILVGWNATDADYPRHPYIHELFAERAARQPDAVALVCDSVEVTYQELNRRANQLAHYLRGLGVGPESRVGVLLERSAEMVVSLLAVLKAGAAYVPLDPGYPQERLRYMIEDASPAVLLTKATLFGDGEAGGARVVDVEQEWERVSACEEGEPETMVSAESLAYLIYTSGSTGRPKGAMNTHAGILNRLWWMQETYQLTAADRVLQKTPFSFDVSVWEFFWPLMFGARLVVAKPGGHQDSGYLRDLIRETGVTVLHFVPSMLQVFVEEGGVERCVSIRQIISSGEALSVSLQQRVQELLPRAELDNLYGPTEAAVDVTRWRCVRAGGRAVVPIGRPIANVQMYVLDERMEPVPAGILGELYIGGVNVGRGYWRRAALTAERFVPHPHSARAGERLYRTGDLGRYLSDGEIEYVGRVDHQVKVRGNRIELGEIEAALSAHHGVREAVVCVSDGQGVERQLVAYLVARAAPGPAVEELREHLRARVPEYMIPALFVELPEMPLSPNGKVDRRRLPEPGPARPELAQAFVAPSTEGERALAEIWSQVLRLERVGVHDNFFALGGDSIRSIQVRSLARKRGLDFTLPQLFQSPTIHALASLAASGDGQEAPARGVRPFELISAADRELLPASVEDAYPLAMLQSGMLFHSEFNQGTAAYHNVTSYHLRAPFDLEKMQAAVGQVLARHPALRTSFDLFSYSQPLQLVHREVFAPVQVEDIRHLSEPEQKEVILRWKEAEKATPFDWSRPPLIRFRIHLRGEGTFQFSFSEHHAIVDGWSVATMLTELFSLYFSAVGLKAAPPPPPPPPSLAYRDFIALEQAALASEATEQFWLGKLKESSATTIPRWPARYREREQKGNRSMSVSVSPQTTQGLKRLAQATGAPLKSVLLAAHLRVLSMLSGQADVLTGLVANGRLEEEGGERVLGLFLNTLPFGLGLRGGSWEELVAAAFAAERELLPHRRYPMAQLQRRVRRSQLFDTSFDFTHFHVYQSLIEMKEVLLEYDGYEETNFTLTTNFALSLETDQVWLSLYYLPRELAAEQVEAISGYYLNVLTEMAERPHGRYEHFSPLNEAEREELLLKWNDTARGDAHGRLIHEWVAAQAARQPDAVALVCPPQRLTYAELNRRANQLAHYLRGLGVGHESRVGVLLERSAEMVVSLLAVLKAGAAYVPLDPEYPRERLRYMIEDAGLSVLLTKGAAGGLADESGARVVDVEQEWERVGACEEGEPETVVSAESLAYLIYTSGSTGRPKGVQVSHGALINFLYSMQREPGFEADDSLMAVTSLSFDIAGLELYLPLLAGGSVVLVGRQTVTDAVALIQALEEHRVTVMQATPTTWRMLVEAGWAGDPGLKILCGGEALSLDLAEELLTRGASVWNMYGPTETTIWSTVHRLEKHEGGVAIGRPIDNTQVFIVDERMNPLPAGAPGELLIGGDGLARGYRNRPDITAEKFIPNPFGGAGGARLYRTGDLARFHPDGRIECLGRLDNQVKVHGYRIELGEIETVLMRHERVREAVVVARADERAGLAQDELKRLVAYVIPDEQTPPDTSELHLYLKERLPDYMLPTAFVSLDAWPLTPNGKVDRKALPAPEQSRPALAAPPVAPRNALEESLAGLWSQVLGVAEVGVFDNFFELGGDSILSLQITARARQQGLQLRPAQIFAHPNIAALASAIHAAGATQGAGDERAAATTEESRFSMARLDPRQLARLRSEYEPAEDIYPLSPMQQGMFFNHLYEPSLGRGIEQIGCRLEGALDVAALRDAWEHVVARHDVLRTAVAWEGLKSPVQVVAERVALTWNELDWSDLPTPEQDSRLAQFLAEDRERGFDITRAPLMRLHLIRLGDGLHHFVWSHHHLLLDGWSVPLVMREVLTAYESFRRGAAPQWPAARPYRDYIAWLGRQDMAAARGYWERTLAGVSGATRLGNRLPHTDGDERAGERQVRLTAEESEGVRRAAQAMQVTVNTLVQGAWAVVLGRHKGEREAVYGVTVNGRPAELEGVGEMIGLFINSLPARVRVEPEQEVGEWLRGVQAAQAEGRQYEYSPLQEVQRWAGVVGGGRLFESLVVFENYPVEESLGRDEWSLRISHVSYVDPPQAELMLMVVPGEQTLIRLMYHKGFFADETGEQLLEHFRTVLLSFCRHTSGRVRDLEFPAGMEPRPHAPAMGKSFAADEFSFEVG
ncbi:MAG: amino acid adenylation domain-containing protein [Pyrinomonadaceae bacterium]